LSNGSEEVFEADISNVNAPVEGDVIVIPSDGDEHWKTTSPSMSHLAVSVIVAPVSDSADAPRVT